MKKRILALLLVCFTLMAFSVSVSANGTKATMKVGTVDVAAATGTTIIVPIELDFIPSEVELDEDEMNGSLGIRSFGLKVNFDNTALKVVNKQTVLAGNIPNGEGTVPTFKGVSGATAGVANNANRDGYFTISYSAGGSGSDNYIESMREGNTVLVNLKFTLTGTEPEDGLADISVEIDDINEMTLEDGSIVNVSVKDRFNLVSGGVKFASADEGKPETTVVKTFPKRFYADNAITTVGVILEGKDYDNATAVKAGIKSQRDEVNVLKFPSAPIASTTDEDKSFVMVTLGDITEDTVFQPTTATWAYVDLDGVEIEGDPVTENTSDATEVVDFE